MGLMGSEYIFPQVFRLEVGQVDFIKKFTLTPSTNELVTSLTSSIDSA